MQFKVPAPQLAFFKCKFVFKYKTATTRRKKERKQNMSAKVLYVTYRKPDEPHLSFAFTESTQVEQYNECAYIKQPKNTLSQSSDFVEAGECVKWQSVTKVEINFAHRLKCKYHMVTSYKEHN